MAFSELERTKYYVRNSLKKEIKLSEFIQSLDFLIFILTMYSRRFHSFVLPIPSQGVSQFIAMIELEKMYETLWLESTDSML